MISCDIRARSDGERAVGVQVGRGDRGPSRAAGDLPEIALQLVEVVRVDLPVTRDVSGCVCGGRASGPEPIGDAAPAG